LSNLHPSFILVPFVMVYLNDLRANVVSLIFWIFYLPP